MGNIVTFDRYIFATLMADLIGHDHRPSAFSVYVAIWTAGDGKRVSLSLSKLAELTGLSRRTIQDSVAHLKRRELIHIDRDGPTETARYCPLTPWRRFTA
jgi:hypothetical protein